jgi:hypothetical protein
VDGGFRLAAVSGHRCRHALAKVKNSLLVTAKVMEVNVDEPWSNDESIYIAHARYAALDISIQ